MKIAKFIKNSLIDFPRHIASVCFTYGCNWRCWYCQNAQLLENSADLSPDFFSFLEARKGWIDGVVICGGEPTIHADLPEFIGKIKSMSFDVKLDTNGTNPEMIKYLISHHLIDYVAMDVKAPKEKLEKIVCSKNSIEKIEQSKEILLSNKVEYEFRTTVTPDLDENDISKMAQSISGAKKYFLQQYHKPDFMKNAPNPLPIEELKKFVEIAKKYVVSTQLR